MSKWVHMVQGMGPFLIKDGKVFIESQGRITPIPKEQKAKILTIIESEIRTFEELASAIVDESRNPLRVLIVEDDPFRMEIFEEYFEYDDMVWAKTAEKGIEWLQNQKFDLVMLDHDLADEHYGNLVESGKGTGQEVARFIAEMASPPTYAFVHSWNNHGARAIKRILDDAGVPNFVATFGSRELKKGVESFRNQWLERS